MYDVIIVGMGIGGITAGIYAKRAGLNVLMLEADMPGGMLKQIDTVTNYPGYPSISGFDLAMNLMKQVDSMKIPYKIERVISVEKGKVITNKDEYLGTNIIIATGKKSKMLECPKVENFIGKGISTCAVCDGILYRDEDVAVVGVGKLAYEAALYLSNICKNVYIICNKLSGSKDTIEKINNTKNIIVKDGLSVKNIIDKDDKFNGLILSDDSILSVKCAFVYLGFTPNTDIVKDIVDLDDNGSIIVHDARKTSTDGIYAVGDCISKKLYQLITAACDGAIAASNIKNY